MSIPGSNLLNIANTVITRLPFQYYKNTGRTLNSIGLDESQYADPVLVYGNPQPVPRNMFQSMGLDFQKSYFNFFLPSDIIDIGRDVSGDQFEFQNKRFQCLSKTDWYGIDGWDQVLAVQVPTPTS